MCIGGGVSHVRGAWSGNEYNEARRLSWSYPCIASMQFLLKWCCGCITITFLKVPLATPYSGQLRKYQPIISMCVFICISFIFGDSEVVKNFLKTKVNLAHWRLPKVVIGVGTVRTKEIKSQNQVYFGPNGFISMWLGVQVITNFPFCVADLCFESFWNLDLGLCWPLRADNQVAFSWT